MGTLEKNNKLSVSINEHTGENNIHSVRTNKYFGDDILSVRVISVNMYCVIV